MTRLKTRIVWITTFVVLLLALWLILPIVMLDQREYNSRNTIVQDRNGEVLFRFPKERYTYFDPVPLAQVPELFKNLLIWKEDRSFHSNFGVALPSKAKLLTKSLITMSYSRGGSTITEQWIKNKYFHSSSRNIFQKVREMILAPVFTMTNTKDDILEEYINHIYFGELAYGIEAATNIFFDKKTHELNPTEQIFLLSLISNPSVIEDENYDFTKLKKLYLDHALQNGWVTELEYEEYSQYKIHIDVSETSRTVNTAFLEMLRDELSMHNALDAGGSIVTATLDKDIQEKVYDAALRHFVRINDQNVQDMGIVILDAKSGDIISLIGTSRPRDEKKGSINTTIQRRQIASTIKPFLFLYAIANGMKPENIILDAEKTFPIEGEKVYRVRNYNGLEYGAVTLAQSLANSLNVPAIKLTEHYSHEKLYEFFTNLGFNFDHDADFYGLSIGIGTPEISLLRLVSLYTIFPHLGEQRMIPRTFIEIQNGKSNRTYSHPIQKQELNLDTNQKHATKTITNILSDENVRQLSFRFNSIFNDGSYTAYKTGTSADFHDNWAIGYNDDYVVGVWIGNLSGEKMNILSGVEGSGPILTEIVSLLGMEREQLAPLKPLERCEESFVFEEDVIEYKEILPEKTLPACLE